MTVTLPWGDDTLVLLPERAALLAAQRTLLIADAHIGKAASFRRLGVPVPHGTSEATFALLSRVIDRTQAQRVIFLGDFLHSAHSHAASTLAALARWRNRHANLPVTLVRGNHDQHAGDPPAALGFDVVEEPLQIGAIALCHHPQQRPGVHVLAGHLHPCVTLGGRANDRVRLPCFHFHAQLGVLPAFGAFTGMHAVQRQSGDRVFAVADGAVLAVP